MLLKDKIRETVILQKKEHQQTFLGVPRELKKELDLKSNYSVIITGIRRCGKSTLLRQIADSFKKYNYFNFDDQRIFGFNLEDFENLDSILNEKSNSKVYLFDEIQSVNKWEMFVRTEQDKGNKFFVSGSNASLLSRELGSKLTGRHLSYELFPFSYKEFLLFKKLKPNVNSFQKYFEMGGFPEFIKWKNPQIHRQIFDDVLTRDIVVRYGLRNPQIVKELALYLTSNAGKEYSNNNLKSLFQLGSTNSVINYISYFEDSYLLFSIPRFSYSLKKQINSRKKIYSIDPGLARSISLSFSKDEGRILENIVFLQLKRKFHEIFFFQEKQECDFIVKEQNVVTAAYQVCFELNQQNMLREINGLISALNEFNLSEGLILSYNQHDKFIKDGKKIVVMPLFKWLIQ